jgi:hypothetical protein
MEKIKDPCLICLASVPDKNILKNKIIDHLSLFHKREDLIALFDAVPDLIYVMADRINH